MASLITIYSVPNDPKRRAGRKNPTESRRTGQFRQLPIGLVQVPLAVFNRLAMARFNPYTLQMQISRMFEQGQSFFATTKVHDWLRERHEDPNAYEVIFHERPAPPGSGLVMVVEVELRRRDGKPVDAWLQEEVNRHG